MRPLQKVKPAVLRTHRKAGLPSNLAIFREQYDHDDPIKPIGFAKVNDLDWYETCSGFVVRQFRHGRDCAADLNMLPAMCQYLDRRIEETATTRMARHFERFDAEDPEIPTRLLPPELMHETQQLQANEVGAGLMRFAMRKRYIARDLIRGWCNAASSRMRLVLTDYRFADFGAQIINLVEDLQLPWLGWILIGYRVGNQKTDTAGWLVELKLPPNTTVELLNVPNNQNDAATNHIAIEVIHRGRNMVAGEFRNAMIYAAIVEIWRLARPRRNCRTNRLIAPGLFCRRRDQP